MKKNNKILYEKIMRNIAKQVKNILKEDKHQFDVVDYGDYEDDIIDYHSIKKLTNVDINTVKPSKFNINLAKNYLKKLNIINRQIKEITIRANKSFKGKVKFPLDLFQITADHHIIDNENNYIEDQSEYIRKSYLINPTGQSIIANCIAIILSFLEITEFNDNDNKPLSYSETFSVNVDDFINKPYHTKGLNNSFQYPDYLKMTANEVFTNFINMVSDNYANNYEKYIDNIEYDERIMFMWPNTNSTDFNEIFNNAIKLAELYKNFLDKNLETTLYTFIK